MMGRTHAASGFAVWLAGSAVATHYGHHQPAAQVAIGAVLCAGGSLQPDWDLSGRVTTCQGGATVAKTFGVASLFVAECVEKASLAVYYATKRGRDPDRDNGHRLVVHGAPVTALAGVGVYAACSHWGRWAVLPVLFFMTACALRAILGGKHGWVLLNLLAVALTAVALPLLPHGVDGYRLLGLAVGVGALVHLCGDALTEHGTPFLAPFTYHTFGLPKVLRCKTGGAAETAWSWLFALVAAASAATLLFPAAADRVLAAL